MAQRRAMHAKSIAEETRRYGRAPDRYEEVEFSPIMLVFHEEAFDEDRLTETPAWQSYAKLEAAAEKAHLAEKNRLAKVAEQRAAEKELLEFKRLQEKFGGGND